MFNYIVYIVKLNGINRILTRSLSVLKKNEKGRSADIQIEFRAGVCNKTFHKQPQIFHLLL